MDVQDHKKITSSEHEIHGVHLCHKCGWPFPNPHPSAKHRRAHKRLCGTIEGYKLIDSGPDHANLAGSDDEHLSDDEHRNPSPNVDKGSIKESGSSGGMGLKSNRSEDELFSDAVAEFSDNRVGPGLEEGSESVKKLNKNLGGEFLRGLEGSHISKDEKTADTSQSLHGLTQLPQGAVKAGELADSDIARSERNQSEMTKSISIIGNENVSVGVSSSSCLEYNSSQVISEVILVSDDSTADSLIGKQKDLVSSGLETDIEEKEKGDEAVDMRSTTASAVDVHSITASEVLQSEHKSEIEPKLDDIEGKTSGPVAQEAAALEREKDTSEPLVESDFQSKSNTMKGETSHAGMVDEIVIQEKVLNDLQFKHDASSQIELLKLQDASLVSEVESDSAKNLICSSQADEVCDLKEAGNENTYLLSTVKMLPAEENPEVMIGDFKDYKVLKSGGPLDVGAAEEIRYAEDDKKDPIPENLQNALSNVPAGSVDDSSSDALEGELEKQGVSIPIDGADGIFILKNLPSALSNVPAGTVDNCLLDALEDDLKEEGASTPIGGEIGGTPVPDLPSAHSSVTAQNVANSSSKKVPDPENLQNAPSNGPAGSLDDSFSDAMEGNLEKEGETSHAGIVDEIVIQGKALTNDLQFKHDVSSQVEPPKLQDTFLVSEVESDSAKNLICGNWSDEVCDLKEAGKENIHLLSIEKTLPAEENPKVMIGDFRDYKVLKPGAPLELGAAEEIRSAEDDKKDPIPENLQNAVSNVPAGSLDKSSSDALEGDLGKEGVSIPIGGAVGIFVPENLSSAVSSVPAGTVDTYLLDASEGDLKEEGVSTPIGGEVGNSFPDILSAHSIVPACNVGNSYSKKVPDLENLQSAPSDVPARSVDNSSVDALEGNLDKGGVRTPIDEEVGLSVPENLSLGLSSVPAGTVDNSSLIALKDDLKKEGLSTPIGGEIVGTSVTENLPSPISRVPAVTVDDSSLDDLKKECVSIPICGEVSISVPALASADSTVPAGTVHNSSSEALEDDIKKKGGGDVGTSIPQNLPSTNVPAGTVDISALEPLEDDIKREVVSTPSDGEVGVSIPENLQSALLSVPAGSAHNSSSEALEHDHEEEGVSTPSDGKVVSSVPDYLPSVLSSVPAVTADDSSLDDLKKESVSIPICGEVSTYVRVLASADSTVPAGTVHNSSSEALEDDIKKKGGGDVGTSVPQHLPSALSSVPAGTVDISALEPLEDDIKKEVVSTPTDGKVGTSVPDNLPGVLSCVPAGTADNASKGDHEKEGVSTPTDMEVGSSGFRVTRDEDNHLLSVAGTLPALENPEAMIGDFKDYKQLKSSFSLDIGAAEEIKSLEDDKKVNGRENPGALSNVPAGSIGNSSSDALQDDHKKECVSIPIDGEVGASRFMGTSDEENQLLSVADTTPVVENPEVMIGESKDYKVLESSFLLDLGAAEETRSVENDKVTVPENLPSALSNVPAGSIDGSSSNDLEHDLKKEGVSIPIDGENVASEFRVGGDADFGSSGLVGHTKSSGSETNDNQLNNNLEGSHFQSVDGKSLQNEDSEEPTTREHSDVIPLKPSTGEQTLPMTNFCGSENADNHGIDKFVCVATENGNVEAGDELSTSITTSRIHVEAIPETMERPVLLSGDDSLGLENSSMGFSSIAGNETAEIAAEERLIKHTHSTYEPTLQLPNSASLDEARGSNQANIDVRDSGKLCNSSGSPKCSDEIPRASEGLEIGEETEIPRSSGAPAVVSELKYDDPTLSSETTSENSRSKKIADFPLESEPNESSASVADMNIRDITILGPLLDDGEDKVTKPNLSVLAVDNTVVSSSRTDSLEGNWGSVSVLSTQSDVTAVADAEVLSSTDTQATEKLDDALKKPRSATMECHPDKSDVFEPPSFMTLVESGVEADKKAATSEIQTAQRDERSKSEALQAGWFPSITNVVNESEGRKKNEEIIAKVTNWSTGKQHSPLKNLLSEAHAETKVKSPNTKQIPAVNQADETASKNKGTAVTTVGSILGSEMPSADTVKKEMEKEWNSPARYPIQIKKEKRKGKPYWVPFVCCTSVHQDV